MTSLLVDSEIVCCQPPLRADPSGVAAAAVVNAARARQLPLAAAL